MAAQNFIQLGLDVSSFNSAKKAKLNEFIDLFDKLSKYDGLKINPVLGEGLAAFNTAIKETSLLINELNTKINTLNANKVSSKSFSIEPVKQFGKEVENSTKKVKDLKKEVDASGASLEGFGRSLTRGLGFLRTAAFILPGVGIAGIFNFAFEGIGNALEAMGAFTNKQKEAIELQIKWNEEFKELNTLMDSVDKTLSGWGDEEMVGLKANLELMKAQGHTQHDILESELAIANLRKNKADEKFNQTGGEQTLDDLRKEVIGAEQAYLGLKRANDEYVKGNANGYTEIDKQQFEAAKSTVERAEYNYKKQKDIVNEYYSSISAVATKAEETNAFEAEQARRIILENAKVETESVKNKNSIILSDERSTLAERIDALKQIELATQRASDAQVDYVKSRPDYKNSDGTETTESKAAINKAGLDKLEATRKYNEQVEKEQIIFYQRLIKATTEKSKDEVEQSAIANEKIYENDKISLDKRLDAYVKYITAKQFLNQLEYNRDIQKGASGPGGKTSLIQSEKDSLLSTNLTQQANIAANAQKQVYDIVYSSLRRTLKATTDEIKENEDISKESYTKALHDLNQLYDKKQISLKQYHERRKDIDYEYEKKELDARIIRDEIDLLQLKKTKEEEIDIIRNAALAKLAIAKSLGNKNEIAKAQGEVDASTDAANDAAKEVKTAADKLAADKLRREKLAPPDDKEKARRIAVALDISTKLLDIAKKFVDEEYEYRLRAVEKKRQLVDEQYGYEIDAIEKSSLTAKDKAALDIQLQAQKAEANKAAQKEEMRLRYEMAVFDKKITISKIVFEIAKAVASGNIPLAIAAGAELAAVIATEIPAYSKGTDDHPGGLARTGEAGIELIKEPYKSPYFVTKDNISYLPEHTKVIPMKDNVEFGGSVPKDESWKQFMWLAKQLKKPSRQEKVTNVINIDLGYEKYKKRILGK